MESKIKTRKQQWVTSSFDGYQNLFSDLDKSSRRFSKSDIFSQRKNADQELWVEKYAPKNKEELAVHKKKISEVEEWLKNSFTFPKHQSSILLLSGPAGSCKTATIQVLCKELKIEIKEWVNPSTSNKEDILADRTRTPYESQISVFWDFMFRANKYPSLNIIGKEPYVKRTVLIEDFPNFSLQNTNEFHRLLRQFHHTNLCSAVFIMSDNSTSLNIKKLFPQQLQEELGIKNISFNPVSASNMLKVLNKVAAAEISPTPGKNVLESLAQLVSGDIRMAFNTLQFAYLRDGSSKIASKQSKKPAKKTNTVLTTNNFTGNEKDMAIFLFHALGKILHCKRALDQPTDEAELPSCLKHEARHPLLTQPEDIVNNVAMPSGTIGLFLHHNFPKFLPGIEEVVNATKYLSDSDIFISEWSGRDSLEECAGIVVVRGLMHSNPSTTGMGWNPIYNPYWFTANKLILTRKLDLQRVNQDFLTLDESLLTETLPYYHLLKLPYKSAEIALICQQLCSFSNNYCQRIQDEQLSEKDVMVEEQEIKDISTTMVESDSTIVHETEVVNLCDEELVISEYSD